MLKVNYCVRWFIRYSSGK